MDIDDKNFRRFNDKADAVLYYSQKIERDFDFLNQQIQTDFHEIDIKRYETRQCVALGLGISAIVMISVTLEECLKTFLKYHHFILKIDKSVEGGLEEWGKASLEAEDAFGTYMLHNAIQKARKEELITLEEESILIEVKEFIRNAFVHSDKSKIFDASQKIPVASIGIKDDGSRLNENREMNILELNFAQGFAEKKLADENCLKIFQDVDHIIVTICQRFWATHHRSGEENK